MQSGVLDDWLESVECDRGIFLCSGDEAETTHIEQQKDSQILTKYLAQANSASYTQTNQLALPRLRWFCWCFAAKGTVDPPRLTQSEWSGRFGSSKQHCATKQLSAIGCWMNPK